MFTVFTGSTFSTVSSSLTFSISSTTCVSSSTTVVAIESFKSVTTSLPLLSSVSSSATTVSTTGAEPDSSFSLAMSVAYTADVATLCNTNTAIANIDKNLFMFIGV